MDHLPHPQDAAFPPITIPYYDQYKYDGGSFTDYPIRCGFDKAQFIWGDFRAVPSNDHDSFFQAWLFFGLIHEFFGANHDEFIDHQEHRVTTTRLPYWVAKWKQSLPIFSRSRRIAECQRVHKCLREVRDTIIALDDRKIRQKGNSHLSEEVAVSIIVLGLTLDEIKCFMAPFLLFALEPVQSYLSSWSPSGGMKTEELVWPNSELAHKRLEATGLCKSEVSRLERYMFSSSMLYYGSMRSFGRISDHSRCSEHRCAAEDINEETYETAHAEGCKGCEHDGPTFSALASVLLGKNFPVIGLTKSETISDIRIDVLPHRKSMAYTAITHVWADRLGNPHGNTLPQCQILRLYQLLQSNNRSSEGRTLTRPTWMRMPSSSETNTVYLWIDTLCVPLEKKFRKRAISLMYNVYKKANRVLLLDRSLLSISAERPTEELCFRITATAWMRRAWTLQEGALAKSLYVQFADRAIHAPTAMESLIKRTEGATSSSITLRQSCTAILYVQASGDNNGPDQLTYVLGELQHRSTSHLEDKLICFAIMMGYDMDRIMDAEGDFRTQRVYQQIKSIPRSFLWHDGPKLGIPGFRWAPKDLVSLGGVDLEHVATLSDRGLLVRAHGMVYFGRSHYMTQWTVCIRDFTSGKWYNLRWLAGESFDGAVVKSDMPWTILAVILKPGPLPSPTQNGVVIRLDWDLSVVTPQELLSYIRRYDTISGEYMGRANLEELNQIDTNGFEQLKAAEDKRFGDVAEAIRKGEARLEDFPQHQWQILEGDNSWLFEGEMQVSDQKWCVT